MQSDTAASPTQAVRLAVASGGPWLQPADHPANLGGALRRAARLRSQNGLVYLDQSGREVVQTYPQLLEEAERIQAGLRLSGLKPGQPVIFQLERNDDFVPAFWACALGGYVPVPIGISPTYEQPHNVTAKLINAWRMLDQPLVLTTAELAPRLSAMAHREKLDGFRTAALAELRRARTTGSLPEVQPSDLAVLLLTSGSTGVPKAVRQTHGRLLAWASSVGEACDFGPDDVSINWMPLDHVGGLVMFHVRDVVLGCRQVHAPTDVVLQRPLIWLDWIQRYRATITWAPNFAYGLVNECAEEIGRGRWDLSSMRFILNGGEAIVSRTARRFLELLQPHGLPATAMRPAWGMSETSSGVTYSRSFTLDRTSDADPFVEVGGPIGGIEVRIVDQHDEPVADGRSGRLQIRGISITDGYHRNDAANRSSFTRDGWFVTGDLGVLKDGRLSITGREKDIIIINGVNFYSHELEAAVEEIEGVEVSFTAACAIRRAGENTDRIAIFFCPTAEGRRRLAALVRTIRTTVARKEGVTPDFIVPLEKGDIPKTAIGKIQRSQLRERFERGELKTESHNEGLSEMLMIPAWRFAELSGPAVAAGTCFVVIADGSSFGSRIVQLARAAGHRVISVAPGGAFSGDVEAGFVIDVQRGADYAQLIASIPADWRKQVCFVHALALAGESTVTVTGDLRAAQQPGALSVMRLSRALGAAAGSFAASRIVVVTRGLNVVRDQDRVDLRHGPLLGVVRALRHELASPGGLVHLDLEGPEADEDAEALWKVLSVQQPAAEIAVRGGQTYVPVLRPVEGGSEVPFSWQEGGTYAVTGALGGIGRVVVEALARRCKARLLLFGQQPLPERSCWKEAAAPDARLAERIRFIEKLEEAGATVCYEAGDLTDSDFVNRAVSRATEHWGRPLDAVLHLAGRYHEVPLAQESEEGFWSLVGPKFLGGWNLVQAARAFPQCVFIHFSSVLAQFGAMAAGSYAAANASLDVLADYQRSHGGQAASLLWSLWSDTGMGRGSHSAGAARVRGYLPLSPEKGFDLLGAALATGQTRVLVGLDRSHRAIRQQTEGADGPAPAGPVYDAPRTETEEKLAAIWQEHLRLPRVGRQDNFFELGGRSLMAAKIFAHIEKVFGQSLPLATFFRAPTIELLAALLDEPTTKDHEPVRMEALQPKGGRRPFFCIPGGASDVIVFTPLARLLGEDQPFFGLQAEGLDGVRADAPYVPMKELAGHFVRRIQSIQPEGPYRVGGHCFGALIAYEVAQQLHASGQDVELLALLDPTAGQTVNTGAFDSFGQRLQYQLKKLFRRGPIDAVKFFFSRVYNLNRAIVVKQRLKHSFDRVQRLHQGYTLAPYAGSGVIFLAADSWMAHAGGTDPRRHWEQLMPGRTGVVTVAGDHHTMLHGVEVADLAEKLRVQLERLDAASGKKQVASEPARVTQLAAT